MDWKKAKTIFILLLLGLNLFLSGTLLYGNTLGAGKPEYEAHAAGLLASREILYPEAWPKGPDDAGLLRFESGTPELKKLLALLLPDAQVTQTEEGTRTYRTGSRMLTVEDAENGIPIVRYADETAGYRMDLSSASRRDREMGALLRAMGFGSYHLRFHTATEKDGVAYLTYAQPYKGGMLFDNRVCFGVRSNAAMQTSGSSGAATLSGGDSSLDGSIAPGAMTLSETTALSENAGLVSIDIRLHDIGQMMSPVGGGTGQVLTAQQALVLSPLRGPLTIETIKFGWGQGNAGEFYFSPVWFVQLGEGQEIRLDAYSGLLLSP